MTKLELIYLPFCGPMFTTRVRPKRICVEENPDLEPEMRLSEEAVKIGLVSLLLRQKPKKLRMNPLQSENTQNLSLFSKLGERLLCLICSFLSNSPMATAKYLIRYPTPGWRWRWRILEVIQKGDQEFMAIFKRRNIKAVSQCFSIFVFGYIVKLRCEFGYVVCI